MAADTRHAITMATTCSNGSSGNRKKSESSKEVNDGKVVCKTKLNQP